MATIIDAPAVLRAAGHPAKLIEEYVGRIRTNSDAVSVARMLSPAGWSEPGQTADFDEITVVLAGLVQLELKDRAIAVKAGQAVLVKAGEWVRYSTPGPQGAEYIAVCLPAFAPELAHRDRT